MTFHVLPVSTVGRRRVIVRLRWSFATVLAATFALGMTLPYSVTGLGPRMSGSRLEVTQGLPLPTVLIRAAAGNHTQQCSGFMVDLHTVVTAAHCLTHDGRHLERFSLKVATRRAATEPGIICRGVSPRVPSRASYLNQFDYGTLTIAGCSPDALAGVTPWLVAERLPRRLGRLYTAGYPSGVPAGSLWASVGHPSYDACPLRLCVPIGEPYLLTSNLCTLRGDSGSGVLSEVDGQMRVVAIVVAIDFNGASRARLLTPEVVEFIHAAQSSIGPR